MQLGLHGAKITRGLRRGVGRFVPLASLACAGSHAAVASCVGCPLASQACTDGEAGLGLCRAAAAALHSRRARPLCQAARSPDRPPLRLAFLPRRRCARTGWRSCVTWRRCQLASSTLRSCPASEQLPCQQRSSCPAPRAQPTVAAWQLPGFRGSCFQVTQSRLCSQHWAPAGGGGAGGRCFGSWAGGGSSGGAATQWPTSRLHVPPSQRTLAPAQLP